MRKFYKDPEIYPAAGSVYEFASEEERQEFGAPSLLPMTQEDVNQYLAPPAPTYKQALDSLNAAYQADIAKYNNAFALTMLADGPSEATKMATIRAQYEARKTKHAANVAALKIEYGV